MDRSPRFPSGTSKRWAVAWAGWIAYFAVVERAALKSGDHRAPLSYFLRHALGIRHRPWHRRVGQVVAGGAFVWLIDHLSSTSKD